VTWMEAITVLAAGMAAGTINTVVGSGTLITFPALLALGYPPVVANVSNTVGLVPGSVSGAIGYRRELEGQRSRLLRLGAASLLGGLTGGLLLLALPAEAFRTIVPSLIALGCVLVVAQPWIAGKVGAPHEAPAHGSLWALLGVFLVAIYGGYFGAAQGVLLVAILGIGLNESVQRVNAAKNVLAMLVNAVAAMLFILLAHIAWAMAAGRRLGRRRPARRRPRAAAAAAGAARRDRARRRRRDLADALALPDRLSRSVVAVPGRRPLGPAVRREQHRQAPAFGSRGGGLIAVDPGQLLAGEQGLVLGVHATLLCAGSRPRTPSVPPARQHDVISWRNTLVAANVLRVPDVLSAAAEPHRRRLLQLLASGPRTVNELAGHFPVTRSAISQHLGVLADAGLVTNTKRGRQRFYQVVPSGMAALRAEIDRFWTTELDQLVADATRLASTPPSVPQSDSPSDVPALNPGDTHVR
jgi:uncharacterized protein